MLTYTIVDQILRIRNSGKTNMLDMPVVQKLAYDAGFYELVMLIGQNKKAYINFILTGKR